MIPKDCKRIIEVDFPIATVGASSVREKPIVKNHPQALHQWWARRPLAACRAVLLGLALPDPCDLNCPREFKDKARKILETLFIASKNDIELREGLLFFIGKFSDWDNANNTQYIRIARDLIRAAYSDEIPLVVDPFAGGGSIPVEALRLGCDAFASDLNPVAVLINKVLIEEIPKRGPKLADEFHKVAIDIKNQVKREVREFYPIDSDGSYPIAYLWARIVRCEAPDCGAEIPLMRSFWLSKKVNRRRALRFVEVEKEEAIKDPLHSFWGDTTKAVRLEVFTPKREDEVLGGTVTRAKATCPCCGKSLPPARVRAQLSSMKGGANVEFENSGKRVSGAKLLAVVTLKDGEIGRRYRLSLEEDYRAVFAATKQLKQIVIEWERNGKKGLCPLPDEPTPSGGGSGAGRAFSVQNYGMNHWSDLFTARQLVSLISLTNAIKSKSTSKETQALCSFILSRISDRSSSLVGWDTGGEKLGHVFNRQALPIVWDFAEGAIFSGATGSYENVLSQVESGVNSIAGIIEKGQVQMADATASPLPSDSCSIWFTDPPYYDAVPYADLSDYFYVWLKRALQDGLIQHDLYNLKNPLTPKEMEIVQDDAKFVEGQPKDAIFFERSMSKAFSEGKRVLREDGVGCVVFAHKTTEGWEALLTGVINSGLSITASWPISTERANRLRSQDSAALATSVHLVCRPREKGAPVGEWAELLSELPKRAGDWMERLYNEGVRGADLVFACIGPALEIFSRYSRVETADGRVIELPEYLGKVWEVVGRKALENVLGTAEAKARNGATGVLEEDARLTALFLWTIQSTSINLAETNDDASEIDNDDVEGEERQRGGYTLIFDVVRRFSQPLGIDLPKWEGRIINVEKGVVRLLSVHERVNQLFGEEGAQAMADRIEDRKRGPVQMTLFMEDGARPPEVKGRDRKRKVDKADGMIQSKYEATTLDKVHAAMLLQDGGKTNALRALIESEQQRGPEFMRLANALSALYPPKSEEKRLLDAMLLSAPR